MFRAAFLPWPTPTVTVRSAGTMSPPAKTPECPVIMFGPTATTPSSTSIPGTPSSSERSASCPSASTSESASSSSVSPVGCGKPVSSSSIRSSSSLPPSKRLTVESHFIITPSSAASSTSNSWAGMRSRRATVDDDRVGRAQPLRGAGGVHRRVAAAVDRDAAAELWPLGALHALQQRDRVEDALGLAGGDVGAAADVGADSEEGRVETALAPSSPATFSDLAVQLQLDAEVEDPLHLGLEHVAGQPVLRDAEAHHPAGHRAGLLDRHRVAEPGEVVRSRKTGRPGADDQHPLAARLGFDLDLPAALDRLVAEEALDRVDADRLVELAAVAGGLAGVVADPAHDRRQRVVLHQPSPGPLVARLPLLCLVQPGLDVLARRAGVVAGRQAVDVDGALGAPAAGLVGEAGADVEGDRVGLVVHEPAAPSELDPTLVWSMSDALASTPSGSRP